MKASSVADTPVGCGSSFRSYLNRMITADTIVPDSTIPQTFNRYAYVENNPVNHRDSNGHCQDRRQCEAWISLGATPSQKSKPRITSREDWGARQPGNNTLCGVQRVGCMEVPDNEGFFDPVSNPAGYAPYSQLHEDETLSSILFEVVIHHGGNSMNPITSPSSIQYEHQTKRGWHDIGYHFMVDGNGQIYEGRDIGVRGSHVSGGNTGRIGVLLMGDFEPGAALSVGSISIDLIDLNGDHEPSFAQVGSTVQLLTWLDSVYGIDSVVGHNDINHTECPGTSCLIYIPYFDNIVNQ